MKPLIIAGIVILTIMLGTGLAKADIYTPDNENFDWLYSIFNVVLFTGEDIQINGTMNSTNIIATGLVSCNTIDTLPNGTFICGTDETGGGASTQKEGAFPYLYNDTIKIYWNETTGNRTYYTQDHANKTFVTTDTNDTADSICSGANMLLGNGSCQPVSTVVDTTINETVVSTCSTGSILWLSNGSCQGFDFQHTVDTDTQITSMFYDGLTFWFNATTNLINSKINFTPSTGSIEAVALNTTNFNFSRIGDCGNSDLAIAGNGSCFPFLFNEWITPSEILDIDKEDIESDINTFVDIAGDTMTGNLNMNRNNITNIFLVNSTKGFFNDTVNSTYVNSTFFNAINNVTADWLTAKFPCYLIQGADQDFCNDANTNTQIATWYSTSTHKYLNDSSIENFNISLTDGSTAIKGQLNASNITATGSFRISNESGIGMEIRYNGSECIEILRNDVVRFAICG